MGLGMYALFAAMPIILSGILLVGMRMPAKKAMPIVFLATALIGIFVWDMSVTRVFASTIQGVIITISVSSVIPHQKTHFFNSGIKSASSP